MLVPLSSLPPGTVIYPESDGKPMADNTRQFDWILKLAGNLRALFEGRADVFVAGNQNWYPVEGHPEIVAAPDVYAVFGRPKGDRSSYKQWEEGGVPMTVVFEVLSPTNDAWEMVEKHAFYEEYGAEEYYIYDPDKNSLAVYQRRGDVLRRSRPVDGFVSPRLGVMFRMTQPEMTVLYPDGRPFLSFEELETERRRERQRAEKAEQKADEAVVNYRRLAELGRKARRGEASPEELHELERLESAPG
jgi:Uma2 family endonuclease